MFFLIFRVLIKRCGVSNIKFTTTVVVNQAMFGAGAALKLLPYIISVNVSLIVLESVILMLIYLGVEMTVLGGIVTEPCRRNKLW